MWFFRIVYKIAHNRNQYVVDGHDRANGDESCQCRVVSPAISTWALQAAKKLVGAVCRDRHAGTGRPGF
jgi:hypothetical protein